MSLKSRIIHTLGGYTEKEYNDMLFELNSKIESISLDIDTWKAEMESVGMDKNEEKQYLLSQIVSNPKFLKSIHTKHKKDKVSGISISYIELNTVKGK